MMVQRFNLGPKTRRVAAWLIVMLVASAAGIFPTRAIAQTVYTCFPTCDETDARFLAIAGAGNNAFAGESIDIGFGVPSTASTIEIGIFDGETGGTSGATPTAHWDKGTTPLIYTLYADPLGDGSGTQEILTWSGNNFDGNGTPMLDNAWSTKFVTTTSAAQATGTGNYLYRLHIVTSQADANTISSFKVRTNGTITIKSQQSFSIYSPLFTANDAAIVFPSWPSTSTTTYDGSWNIYLDVPSASSALQIWDGDMDYGKYDGSVLDDDDANTTGMPSWAVVAYTHDEGAAVGDPAKNSDGTTRVGYYASGSPADDNLSAMFVRTPSITYQVVAPDGASYQNNNPSGNLEWEKFLIDTQNDDPAVDDYHATALPAGLYQVQMTGMDMGNINSWRFFNDVTGVTTPDCQVVGVNAAGEAVVPVRAADLHLGEATGTVFLDADADGVRDDATLEPGITDVTVTLTPYDASGNAGTATSTTTDQYGVYSFTGLADGLYRVSIDVNTLQSDVIETYDADGLTTANYSSFTLEYPGTLVYTGNFGYQRQTSGSGDGTTCPGTATRGFWLNHPDAWLNSSGQVFADNAVVMQLGGSDKTKSELLRILKNPTKGDRTYAMAAQLIAAKLNWMANSCYGTLAHPASTCLGSVSAAMTQADYWLAKHAVGSRCSSAAWTTTDTGVPQNNRSASDIHDDLDLFNNGNYMDGSVSCAPHRLE